MNQKEQFDVPSFGLNNISKKKVSSRRLFRIIFISAAIQIIFYGSLFLVTFKYLNYLKANASEEIATISKTKTPNILPTKTALAQKAKTEDIPKCEQISTSNPDALKISTQDPRLSKNQETIYYQIYGRTVNDLKNQLFDCGPKYDNNSFAGMTTDYINWAYMLKFNADGTCKVSDLAVGVNVRIYYPKWEIEEKTNEQVINSFNLMLSSLKIHEEGHKQIDFDGAEKIYNRLNVLSSQSCTGLEELVKNETDKIVEEISQDNLKYDEQTNHGETQGATL